MGKKKREVQRASPLCPFWTVITFEYDVGGGDLADCIAG